MFEKENTQFEYCKNMASSLIDIVGVYFLTFYSPVHDPARFLKHSRYRFKMIFIWPDLYHVF